ncbi:MAG: PAS domain S-box protein [Candidatus Aminicenantes bacterium]|nr:PAS domain S-box protein [Candidatus Aminicenantes bacterium]
MSGLDMRTVMFSHVVTDILSLLVVVFLWRQSRGRYRGVSWWALGFGFQLMGTILIVVRGAVPDWISMTLANTFVLAGAMTVTGGFYRFLGRPVPPLLPGSVLLVLFAVASSFFTLVRPDLEARNLALSAAFSFVFIIVLRMFAGMRGERRPRVGRFMFVYWALLLVTLVRIAVILALPTGNQDFFRADVFNTLVLLAYQTLFILLTYNMALAVNERLVGDLRFQEEKFAKAFRSSPFGIVLTDAFSDEIFDLNEAFAAISGFSRDEAIGKTIHDLKIWEDPEMHARAHDDLNGLGRIRDLDFQLRDKSGGLRSCLWSAERVVIGGRPCVLSCLDDLSMLKKAEDDLARALDEKNLLMRELRHRVKNSLSIVGSLINLSREEAVESAVKGVLSDLRNRIGSVSSVYEQLDRTGQVDAIGLKEYINGLVAMLAKSYGPADGRIRITTDIHDVTLETSKALLLGLIVNELIMNAFKFAFPEGKPGEIRVELMSQAEGLCLIVSDDGVGGPGRGAAEAAGGGAATVDMLADQIGARISRPPGPGTTVVVLI